MQARLLFVAAVGMVTISVIPAMGGDKSAAHRAVKIHELSPPGEHSGPAMRGKRLVYPEQIREAIHGFVLKEIAGRAADNARRVLTRPRVAHPS